MRRYLPITTALLVAGFAGLSTLLGQDTKPRATNAVWESFEDLHKDYVERFIASQGFGITRMPQQLMLDHSKQLTMGSDQYSVESLELVGIIKQKDPVAYRPMRHGERGRPVMFTPRKLTKFEETSLARLLKGEDLLLNQTEEGTFLVGAIRAQASCLECHEDKKKGDLLGAFTYKLKHTENRPKADDADEH
jgi:hypothetical protein